MNQPQMQEQARPKARERALSRATMLDKVAKEAEAMDNPISRGIAGMAKILAEKRRAEAQGL